MNLNEEKKTPLREKDLNMKREMVIQYIFTASKTVSIWMHEYFSLHFPFWLIHYLELMYLLKYPVQSWINNLLNKQGTVKRSVCISEKYLSLLPKKLFRDLLSHFHSACFALAQVVLKGNQDWFSALIISGASWVIYWIIVHHNIQYFGCKFSVKSWK